MKPEMMSDDQIKDLMSSIHGDTPLPEAKRLFAKAIIAVRDAQWEEFNKSANNWCNRHGSYAGSWG